MAGGRAVWFVIISVLVTDAAFGADGKARPRLPDDLVYLSDIAPAIRQDIRYATNHNFTGRRLPGYGRAACILRAPVARALQAVQEELSKRNKPLGLKVFDCYRPQRAVRAMLRWAQRPQAPGRARRYFPSVAKRELFSRGYIARNSSHSQATTVDLTVVRLSPAKAPDSSAQARRGWSCRTHGRDPADPRALDMGTTFDCFDVHSHTRSRRITRIQTQNRQILVNAMARHGFQNYRREWWHFSFRGTRSGKAYDIEIR